MKRKRYTPEEIIKKLREAESLVATGKSVEEASRAIEVSLATYHRWKSEYGGMKKMRSSGSRNWKRKTPD